MTQALYAHMNKKKKKELFPNSQTIEYVLSVHAELYLHWSGKSDFTRYKPCLWVSE
jgi:hypothetical protein